MSENLQYVFCFVSVRIKNAYVLFDDINIMPFTTLLSVQIAKW